MHSQNVLVFAHQAMNEFGVGDLGVTEVGVGEFGVGEFGVREFGVSCPTPGFLMR